ncbi:DUF4112 domain-containing protein [Methylobacterium haplocladii]|uniref:DUF4112 domain-containing protein n=1 Tax=Methylobacterium haplocladii TaxID=1176176 RepID=A0A512IQ21_9HYPH|nr:DUF4112 domain-containing protein [Methylobacterium haplocladii]GEO99833.1 hypothetical protein MHA02_22210 [Methylobacterium haplocladii]GJD84809.1 hypothetical protein HPGCJGGD_2692 [Methylobacterium haplocladii]GLS57997.1 hypothetical protein GCM10007887_06530 [Methylobacterium haplocladii]
MSATDTPRTSRTVFAEPLGAADLRRFTDTSAEASLLRLEQLAHLMDTAFLIPGTNRRVGLDALIGLVPVIGDIAGMAIASYIVYEARRLGAPRWLVWRMMGNVAFDGAVGAVPLAGDLFDAAFKANRRNVRLLRKHLEKKGSLRPNEIEGTATHLD